MVFASPAEWSGWRNWPGMLAATHHLAEDVARDEGDVRRPLGQPAHEVRIPLRAERDVDTHPVAVAHEALLQVPAHAVQHLELVSVGPDRPLLGEPLRLDDEPLVVRREA